ncbi:unnamed protein product [Rotaria magnacalcarata]|uniref:Uncharacterized protein n=1 Tax=Rotaria magnacalcarata TaxID=392030 RepID=A0A8S3IGA9_9BILA|nr:unnamed protein product [Rotaria magnacalcarata]CAF5186706.1 unnamed protein product [Rotaria magnacalcarata]CAF5197364.1 unnamed protein product [Rotaria magnacalcarata]
MQSQIEELEVRYKTDISRLKSKFQAEIDEIRHHYDSLKKVKAELENHLKKLQVGIKEVQDRLAEEQTLHETTRDALSAAEKRNGSLRGEIEELRVLFERSDKARKTTELELHDSEQRLAEVTSFANRAIAERKKFEADAIQYQGEIIDIRQELKIIDERVSLKFLYILTNRENNQLSN